MFHQIETFPLRVIHVTWILGTSGSFWYRPLNQCSCSWGSIDQFASIIDFHQQQCFRNQCRVVFERNSCPIKILRTGAMTICFDYFKCSPFWQSGTEDDLFEPFSVGWFLRFFAGKTNWIPCRNRSTGDS